MTRFDLTTIGEGQIRFTVAAGDRLATSKRVRMNAAGSEANVAGMLAQLGRSTAWATVLPRTDLAERVLSSYRGVGVDLSAVVQTPEGRVATYYFEPAEAPMSSVVTYDRLHTPFREVDVDQLDWDLLLDTRVIFVTGITAALSPATRRAVERSIRAGSEAGVRVAVDINHRKLLWSPQEAREVFEPLMGDVDLLFCSRRDAAAVFGIEDSAEAACERLAETYGVRTVVTTDGERGAHCVHDGKAVHEPALPVQIKDRPGAGDAFIGAFIHGYLDGDVAAGVRYGIRAAGYALTHFGDLTHVSPSDVNDLLTGDIVR
ncbi:sugar kinase [Streptomyces sp. YIM S03343]